MRRGGGRAGGAGGGAGRRLNAATGRCPAPPPAPQTVPVPDTPYKYAALLRGLSDEHLEALAGSFSLASCARPFVSNGAILSGLR